MEAKIQKNIGMDVVNGDVEKIQCVMSINVSAHQVLDKMCQLKGLETKKKMKVLKSWMFKYKPERRRSRKRHNRDWFNTLSRGESGRKHKHGGIAKLLNSIGDKLQSYGYVLDITFIRRLRVHQQQQKIKSTKTWRFKYKSRLKKINLTDTKFWGEKVHGVSCLSLAAQFNSLELIQGNDEVSTKIIDNAASSSGRHAKSLLIEMGFCPTLVQKAIDENGEDLELLLEILTKSTVTEDPSFHGPMEPKPEPDIESETDSRRMTLLTMKFPKNLVALALDRLGNDTPIDEMVYLIVAAQLTEKSAAEFEESLDGTATIEEDEDVVPVAARGPTVSNELLLQTMDKTLHLLEMGFSNHEISMTIDKIGTESQISDLAESIVTGEVRGHFPDDLEGIEKKVSKSWRFVGVDAQKEDGGGGSSRGTANITPDPGIDTFPFPATANLGANVHILPAAEQKSSSIWHRWRRKDCTRTSSCVLSLQFSFFKLEDKLIFGEGSIDTLHQVD